MKLAPRADEPRVRAARRLPDAAHRSDAVMRPRPTHARLLLVAACGVLPAAIAIAQPGPVSPTGPAPGAAAPGSFAPGTTSPAPVGPGSAFPGTAAPGGAAPGPAAPGGAAPGGAAPGLAAPGPAAPSTVVPAGMTGAIDPARWGDRTRHDQRTGPMPLGGQTRFEGQTYVVESAPAHSTWAEIGAGPLRDFDAVVEVTWESGDGPTGLYLSTGSDVEGRPGDLFFGMDRGLIVLRHRAASGWRDVAVPPRGPWDRVRLQVERRAQRYVFRWGGERVAEHVDGGDAIRVLVYAAAGVRARFGRFTVRGP